MFVKKEKSTFFTYRPKGFFFRDGKLRNIKEDEVLKFCKKTKELEYLKNCLYYSVFCDFRKAVTYLFKNKKLIVYIKFGDMLINSVNFDNAIKSRKSMIKLIFKHTEFFDSYEQKGILDHFCKE